MYQHYDWKWKTKGITDKAGRELGINERFIQRWWREYKDSEKYLYKKSVLNNGREKTWIYCQGVFRKSCWRKVPYVSTCHNNYIRNLPRTRKTKRNDTSWSSTYSTWKGCERRILFRKLIKKSRFSNGPEFYENTATGEELDKSTIFW